jgi:hypothetical protein
MFKSGTGIIKTPPPVADAGKRTLAELCPLLGVNETRLLAAARIAGIRVDSLAQTLEDVANQNGLSPEELYILLGDKSAVNPSGK